MLGKGLRSPFQELEEAEIQMMLLLSKFSSWYPFWLYSFVTIDRFFRLAISWSLSCRYINSDFSFVDIRYQPILIFVQMREYFGSLCRSSFYDQIKHIYYKIRSTGTLNYTGVSTSSTINPSNQVRSLSQFFYWVGTTSFHFHALLY